MRFQFPPPRHFVRSRVMWAWLAAVALIVPAAMMGADGLRTETVPSAASQTGSLQPAEPKPQAAASQLAVPSPTAAAVENAVRPAAIDRAAATILIRGVLAAVHQANETGNYTVLRDLGAPGFQTANNAAILSEIFAGLRARGADLSAALALEPFLTVQPEIGPDGMMRMVGSVPAVPAAITFDLAFASVANRWLPFAISIGLTPPPIAAAEKRPESPAQRPQHIATKQRAMALPLEATR